MLTTFKLIIVFVLLLQFNAWWSRAHFVEFKGNNNFKKALLQAQKVDSILNTIHSKIQEQNAEAITIFEIWFMHFLMVEMRAQKKDLDLQQEYWYSRQG